MRLLFTQRLELAANSRLFKLAQGAQTHVENCFGLHICNLESLHQFWPRLVLFTDDTNHFVEIEICDEISTQHFEAMGYMFQAIRGAAQQNIETVIEKGTQDLL